MDFSIPMALVDFIPVFLFGAAGLILLKDFYNKLFKGAYALLAAGVIDVFTAGFGKATHKLLYAAGVCDFRKLADVFFPLQALGFILAGLGIFSALMKKKPDKSLKAVVPVWILAGLTTTGPVTVPEFSGTMIFVALMVLGLGLICVTLCVTGVKLKKPGTIALFVINFLACLTMGYLSSRDFSQSYINWIGEGLNIVGESALLAGSVILHKAGLGD